MIRVLHIINSADHGGISTMLLNYYRYVDRTQVAFDVAVSVDSVGHDGREMEKLGATLYYLPIKSKNYRLHVDTLREILKNGSYDAIHVHSALTSWVDMRVAKKCGVRVRVAHAHNADKSKRSFKEGLKRRVGIILMKRYATARLACSKDAAVYTFGARSLRHPTVHILPNAIECEAFRFSAAARAEVREELRLSPDAFVLGTVGRMTAEKNQIRLVRLMPELLKRRPEARLLLVGDGKCRPAIEAQAQALQIADKVVFTGGRSDVARLLCAMDVFALPSLQEGFGIAALEAAAAGLPVILSDVIPRELELIPQHAFASLEAPLFAWAEQICAFTPTDRAAGVEAVVAAGYDISSAAAALERIYFEK